MFRHVKSLLKIGSWKPPRVYFYSLFKFTRNEFMIHEKRNLVNMYLDFNKHESDTNRK